MLTRLNVALAGMLLPFLPPVAQSQGSPKSVVAILAHADDETPVSPILARYAREGVKVYFIVATDGAQGTSNTTVPAGPELAKLRADEARCAATAIGAAEPILLGFPDAKLGDFMGDRSVLFRMTDRIAAELARIRPDVIVTWGPDGGYGHPDHRMVSAVATQLVRAGAPGAPERLFYMYLTEESIRMAFPARGAPPLLIPQPKWFTMRVSFEPGDLEAWKRALGCHKTQFSAEMMERFIAASSRMNGNIALVPAFATAPGTDLFR